MSALGDFPEAIYGQSDGYRTLRASLRHWRNRELAEYAGSSRPAIGKRRTPKPAAHGDESLLSVWIQWPGRLRVETEKRDGESVRSYLAIVDGDRSWVRDDRGRVEESADKAQKISRAVASETAVDRHFSHASLREFFVSLALEAVREIRVAGHNCVRLRAQIRPGGRLWPHWLPAGADEYTLDVLPGRGVVLAIEARRDGTVFEVNEVTAVAFDEPLDESLFHYVPTSGDQLRPAEPVVEHLSLDAAVRRVPFVVLLPKEVPDADHVQLEVMFDSSRDPSSPPHLMLMYRWNGRAQSLWLNEAATADPDLEDFDWEPISRHGHEMRLSDPDVAGGRRVVALEQSGTHVTIWSDIAREPLLDLAASLTATTDKS